MKLSQVKCGDVVFYAGEPHVAITDGRPTGTSGEAATLATVMLARVSDGETNENGTLELGYCRASRRHVPDEDVQLLRRGMNFHSSDRRSAQDEDGTLVVEKTNYSTADACRAELDRIMLRQARRAEEERAETASFRRHVQRCLANGLAVAELKERTGLSRERIYQIRDGRR